MHSSIILNNCDILTSQPPSPGWNYSREDDGWLLPYMGHTGICCLGFAFCLSLYLEEGYILLVSFTVEQGLFPPIIHDYSADDSQSSLSAFQGEYLMYIGKK